MSITLPDARQLPDAILEALRLRALNGRELGFTEADLANLLGVSRETVCRWWSAYTAHGIDALPRERTGRPLGSGRFLSDEQARRVQRLLDEKTPEELGTPLLCGTAAPSVTWSIRSAASSWRSGPWAST
jgi:transposase